jgi:outer membrane protein TolC
MTCVVAAATTAPGVGQAIAQQVAPQRASVVHPVAHGARLSATPHDIEKSLGSLAGSLATAPPRPLQSSPAPAAATGGPEGTTSSQTVGHPLRRRPIERSVPAAVVRLPAPVALGPYDGQLDPARARAMQIEDAVAGETDVPAKVIDFDLWWQDAVTEPLGLSPEVLPVDVAGLTESALICSPYIQGILAEPEIRRSDIVIADAEFDPLAFLEAKFADTNDPVGDALTTGNSASRFLDNTFTSAAGLQKRSRLGGSLEVVQRGGFQDNNSSFLIPNPQGTTRLEINFTQPLLKDHGRAVNNTRVLLAKIDLQLTNSEVRGELEDHLANVTQAYWDLYQARADWLQRNRLLSGAESLHEILLARGDVDTQQRQILRAEAAVASRKSDLVRAETRIRNAQARVRLLTGDPQLLQATRWELTPQDRPLAAAVQLSAREATITALDNRSDIARSIRAIQSVSTRVGAAKNQVLPRLDLILSTYVAGLEDKTDVFGAWANQFSEGSPSYAAGLRFDIPLGNRASQARLTRSRWELSRSLLEFQQTTEIAFTEVEVAVREVQSTFDETVAKKQAIDAAGREVDYLRQRWELLPDPNESAVLLIENLLDAQERLADEERAFVTAQVAYAMSWVQLRKSMGMLLRLEDPDYRALVASLPAEGVSTNPDSSTAGTVTR